MTTIILSPTSHCLPRFVFDVTSIIQSSVIKSCRVIKSSQVAVVPQIQLRSLALLRRLFISFLGCLVVSVPLHAQTFAELESKLKQHPRLQAMTYQANSDRELSDAALGLPDPVISLGVNNFPVFDPSFDEFVPTNKAVGLKQRFPHRALRRARSATMDAQADQADEMRKHVFSSMRAELITLLYNKVRIKEQRSLAHQRDAKYDQLSEVIESEVGGGRTSVFRLAEIEAERAEVSRSLSDLDAQSIQVDAKLLYLLGAVPTTSPPRIDPIDISKISDERSSFYASRVADSALKVSDSGVNEAKAAWKPEWGANLTYQQREAGTNFDGDDLVSFMVTFTVPFWSKKNQAPKLRAANAKQQAAQAMVSEAQRQALAQYSYAKASRLAALKNVDILKQKVNAINEEVAAQQSNYESGAGVYAPIIDGEITILKLQTEIAAEQSRSQVAAAQMNALLVTP